MSMQQLRSWMGLKMKEHKGWHCSHTQFDGDVANKLDLLKFVDIDEKYEIIHSFAMKHTVPYIIWSPTQM